MRKNILVVLVALICAGCATVKIPKYLPGENPYTQRFFADYLRTTSAVEQALQEFQWDMDQRVHPSVYERNPVLDDMGKERILFITEVRHTPMIVLTRYGRLNVYVREMNEERTEVEIRYVTVSSVPFKTFTNYRKKSVADRLFERIGQILEERSAVPENPTE